MTKVDENMAQAKKMLETIVERDYELQKEVGEWRSKCYILEEENKRLKDDLEHSDSFFSLMRDVLTNENVSSYALWDIVNAVVKEECGAEDELDEEDLEIVKKFWNGYYRTF